MFNPRLYKMATFKAEIIKAKLRQDGTYNVKIRLTHNRRNVYMSTPYYVDKKDVTKAGKIKDYSVLDKVDEQIRHFRKKLAKLYTTEISAKELSLKLQEDDVFRLDFIAFSRAKIEKMKPSTGGVYTNALNSFVKFSHCSEMDIKEVTSDRMYRFKEHLEERGLKRAVSSYPGNIRALFNLAKDEYNGEDIREWKILHDPFKRFKVPKQNVSDKQALTVEQMRELIKLPYRENWSVNENEMNRYNLAKDCFVMSFALLGINSVDLYESMGVVKNNVFSYNRQKTKDRRDDEALISVHIEPEVQSLVEKYLDSERLFLFHKKYSSADTFSVALNTALKEITESLNEVLRSKGIEEVKPLRFYAARHTMATLAQNKAGIDKYTVHEMLNHAYDRTMKVTDIYTAKDWSRLWDANRKLLDLVFDGEKYDSDEAKCESVERVSRSGVSKSPHKGIYPKGNVFRVFRKNGPNYEYVGTTKTLEEAIEMQNKKAE